MKINKNGNECIMSETWPNFIIIGAPKSGTTSLYHYLTQIPEIHMSAEKEPRYFSPNLPLSHFAKLRQVKDKKKYLELFSNGKKIKGEASSCYLEDTEAPKLIKKNIPSVKIIAILRNPVERAFSHYLMDMQFEMKRIPFGKFIREQDKIKHSHLRSIIDAGFYHRHVQNYFNDFEKNQIKILMFEEFVSNVRNSVQEIIEFLGTDYKIKEMEPEPHNPYINFKNPIPHYIANIPTIQKITHRLISPEKREKLVERYLVRKDTKPKMHQQDRKYLEEMYFEDSAKLQDLLGRKFPWDWLYAKS